MREVTLKPKYWYGDYLKDFEDRVGLIVGITSSVEWLSDGRKSIGYKYQIEKGDQYWYLMEHSEIKEKI